MRELTQIECQDISAAGIEVREVLYQGVYGITSSALTTALGKTSPITSALFGGLSAIAAYLAADTAVELFDRI